MSDSDTGDTCEFCHDFNESLIRKKLKGWGVDLKSIDRKGIDPEFVSPEVLDFLQSAEL